MSFGSGLFLDDFGEMDARIEALESLNSRTHAMYLLSSVWLCSPAMRSFKSSSRCYALISYQISSSEKKYPPWLGPRCLKMPRDLSRLTSLIRRRKRTGFLLLPIVLGCSILIITIYYLLLIFFTKIKI